MPWRSASGSSASIIAESICGIESEKGPAKMARDEASSAGAGCDVRLLGEPGHMCPPPGEGVCLVSMPFAPILSPNLALGILKSVLHREGIACDALYAQMQLLRFIQATTFRWIADLWAANDFVFSRELHADVSPEQMATVDFIFKDTFGLVLLEHRKYRSTNPILADKLLKLREEVIPKYLDCLMAEIDFSKYSLVGFTCLFDQTISSLALAHRIKKAYPNIMIAFGGSAINKPVGPALQRAFPGLIDCVAYGDGEATIVPIYEASRGKRNLAEVPNITYRNGCGDVVESTITLKIELDGSPTPNFDDFFLQREELKKKHDIDFDVGEMPLESSRGCWWGSKSHCVFCGIDDNGLKYRKKHSSTVLSQLDYVSRRYGVKAFNFMDYIMPREFLKTLMPQLAELGKRYHLHYETKSNLSEEDIELCCRAGVRVLQPGIESFSSGVLRRMNKGVSAMQNVFTIFTMMKHGIHCFYNFLYGIPGETHDDYRNMVQLLPALYHLNPPENNLSVMMTRYSTITESPELFGGKGPLKAHPRYRVVFNEAFENEVNFHPEDYCLYFENPYPSPSPDLEIVYTILQHQVLKWKERFKKARARLLYSANEDGIVVHDTRHRDEAEVHKFGHAHKLLSDIMYNELCGEKRLLRRAEEAGLRESEARTALGELLETRVVINEGSEYVWIAFNRERMILMGHQLKYHLVQELRHTKLRNSSEWEEWKDPLLEADGRA